MTENCLLVILHRNQVERSTYNFYGKKDGIIKKNHDREKNTDSPVKKKTWIRILAL